MPDTTSIADIYQTNDEIRARLFALVPTISPDEAETHPEGEAWSIKEIIEHLAMVESGVLRICSRLLDAAKKAGKPSNGVIELSPAFGAKSKEIAGIKVEAPERVRPTGGSSIDESLKQLVQARAAFSALKDDLEAYDLSQDRFPHPFFGDLTAAEWMIMLGGHEQRHTRQVERILTGIRQ